MNLPLNDNDNNNNDAKFESFLRQFRPRRPRPLAIDILKRVRRQRFVRVAWAGAAAAIVIAAVLLVITRQGLRQPGGPEMARNDAPAEVRSQGPLTIATANALLARASSVKAAVEQMANGRESVSIPKGKHSALAVLSEEEIKL